MREGAVINVERGRVRLREDNPGVSYELRPGGEENALDVFRLKDDGDGGNGDHGQAAQAEHLGRLVRGRQGWRPEMEKRDRLREQLVVIARAWNRALVLKK